LRYEELGFRVALTVEAVQSAVKKQQAPTPCSQRVASRPRIRRCRRPRRDSHLEI
jgi:hypothetical protein